MYVNGEKAADGSISQTSSGNYAKLREWFDSFTDPENYSQNYIGRSQYAADVDFAGSLSDFRIYGAALTMDEVIEVMCESLTDEAIVKLAADKYLSFPNQIITKDVSLPADLLGGKVSVEWSSSAPEVLSENGGVQAITSAQEVTLRALLNRGDRKISQSFNVSVVPAHLPPYTVTIHGDQKVADISEVMYGLFTRILTTRQMAESMQSLFRIDHLSLLHLIRTRMTLENVVVRQVEIVNLCLPGQAIPRKCSYSIRTD